MITKAVLGFVVVIISGGLILMLPPMTTEGKISFIDALFTSTSATCVTGLIVQDTPTFFTDLGKSVILFLIQIGGLGIMTITSIFGLILGRKINLGDRFYLSSNFGENKNFSAGKFFGVVAATTISIELIGAAVLTLNLFFRYNYPIKNAFTFGLFHSISAFNNAGFSLYSNNLESFATDFTFNTTIMLLIILGGIGFSVISAFLAFKKRKRLSLHTKIVLTTTLFLILAGAVTFFLLEFKNPDTLGGKSTGFKILSSFFQSVTPRTAGFNTVPMGFLNESTLIILTILMFIGASPGGTGGGIKTTTFASITLAGISSFKGRNSITIFKRKIPRGTVYRALTLSLTAIILIIFSSIIIMIIEKETFIKVVFETTSAFGTVGLSTGITFGLSAASKAILILLMFIGRIGISALGLTIASRVSPEKIVRPEESITIG